MDKYMLTVNRVFSFLLGFLLAFIITTFFFMISMINISHNTKSLRMHYVDPRTIIITP